jgi:hypothetical protein
MPLSIWPTRSAPAASDTRNAPANLALASRNWMRGSAAIERMFSR